MRAFQFQRILRKYLQVYTVVKKSGGAYDDDGVWQPVVPQNQEHRGSVQPLSARLRAVEGGNYTESDRMLFTPSTHANGELINHAGIQYRVVEMTEREYSDVNQYLLRKVVANAPVQ